MIALSLIVLLDSGNPNPTNPNPQRVSPPTSPSTTSPPWTISPPTALRENIYISHVAELNPIKQLSLSSIPSDRCFTNCSCCSPAMPHPFSPPRASIHPSPSCLPLKGSSLPLLSSLVLASAYASEQGHSRLVVHPGAPPHLPPKCLLPDHHYPSLHHCPRRRQRHRHSPPPFFPLPNSRC